MRLWDLGIRTKASCQDFGESLHTSPAPGIPAGDQRWADFYRGRVWLKLPADGAHDLTTLLSADTELRSCMREWARPRSWICVRFLVPNAFGATATTSPDAHIFFPREHLPRVMHTLETRTAK